MTFVKTLVKIVIGMIILCLVVGFLRTWQLKYSADQAVFAHGTTPSPLPDGFYNGTVPGHATSWLGIEAPFDLALCIKDLFHKRNVVNVLT